ncbi:lasso peptide biosynthesis B2 protein [Sphingomonas histidinilytica]|uniref:Transglutaminase-like superfamily protein n=1 Tax=Rhizorhabdus histidinilytica TaxID=439228 RepID=A0A1T5G2N8_9SPHN|nr:lasso peptide biosynthesis B2 protein [Rhizorhabdus histidinilytica]MBO9378360.1 lasso peptide biosynthesis B2 protein [Rhizorhabdus histidinilytica]SKC02701.1 Transglutaminase-like superfamily protein [Rhizorhabdus histidinilytica]
MPSLRLALDVHLAIVDGDLVFLDAARDEYLCVPRRHKSAVMAAMTGTPSPSDLLDALSEEGLLVESPAGTAWAGPMPTTAGTDLGISEGSIRVRLVDLLVLGLAAIRTWRDIRLGRPARWFARQRARGIRPRRSAPVSEVHGIARMTARLRPLVPRSGRCLVRSLLLLHMLELRGAHAKWIFGVRTHPFDAHCWVEHDGVVLNDTLEHVRWYTPIVRL